MTKGTKIAAGITRMLLGVWGVDYFVVGRIGKGISTLLGTIFTVIMYIPVGIVAVIPVVGQIVAPIATAILTLSLVIRGIICFVTGIIILASPVAVARVKYLK